MSLKRFLPYFAFGIFVFFAIRTWRAGNNDFIAYYNAGLRVLAGHTPYEPLDPTPFRYLPITAFFFAPLALLPLSIARILFFIVNFAAATWIYRKIDAQIGALATTLLLILFFRFHNHDFQNAQVNPVLLLLLFTWWKTRERNLILATLAFSVFASFKIVPFALGLPLLFFRRWGEISWIAIWTMVLNFLPVFFLDRGAFVFMDWFEQASKIGYPVPMMSNIQSLPSALWWWLEGRVDPAIFVNAVRTLQAGILLAVLALAPRKSDRERMDWMIAGTLAATVILTPLAWKHNYLQFLPLAYLWFREDPGFREMRTRVLYGFSLFGLVLLPSALSSWNRELSNRSYIMVWSGFLVIFASLRYYRSRNESESHPHLASA